jgi:MYXO-CTERM domain-containing protein
VLELFAGANFSGLSYATKTTVIPAVAVLNTKFSVPFDTFTLSGGFDFSNVGSIRMTLQGPNSYDMVLHSVEVGAPEASTLVPVGALALVGVGYGVIRRRRSMASSVSPAV